MLTMPGMLWRAVLGLFLSISPQTALAAGAPYSTDTLKIFLLIGGLGAAILALMGGAAVAQGVLGFFQHRRSCKIPAVLETKDHSFDGHITVIGLNGCRFQPLNKTTEGKLLRLLASPVFHDYDIRIKDMPHPVFVDGFYVVYAPLYFYDPITRAELTDLLQLSRVAPDLAPRIGRPTTGKTYRQEIARRREMIDRLKGAMQH